MSGLILVIREEGDKEREKQSLLLSLKMLINVKRNWEKERMRDNGLMDWDGL